MMGSGMMMLFWMFWTQSNAGLIYLAVLRLIAFINKRGKRLWAG